MLDGRSRGTSRLEHGHLWSFRIHILFLGPRNAVQRCMLLLIPRDVGKPHKRMRQLRLSYTGPRAHCNLRAVRICTDLYTCRGESRNFGVDPESMPQLPLKPRTQSPCPGTLIGGIFHGVDFPRLGGSRMFRGSTPMISRKSLQE